MKGITVEADVEGLGSGFLMPFDVVRDVVRTSFETSSSIATEFNVSQVFLGFVEVWYHHKAVKKR